MIEPSRSIWKGAPGMTQALPLARFGLSGLPHQPARQQTTPTAISESLKGIFGVNRRTAGRRHQLSSKSNRKRSADDITIESVHRTKARLIAARRPVAVCKG